jgi:two-component system, sensor histidine kinase YesM
MIDPEILDNPIPKLTLQPIVENAIYHGLREKNGRGTICIYSEHEDQLIRIIVEDAGKGMKNERLKELEKAIENEGNVLVCEVVIEDLKSILENFMDCE